jgi:hypothetical protein
MLLQDAVDACRNGFVVSSRVENHSILASSRTFDKSRTL